MTFELPHPVVLVAQGWPCWLPSLLSLRIPLGYAYFPTRFHEVFGDLTWQTAHDFERRHLNSAILLGSGSRKFWLSHFAPAITRLTAGCALFCLETPFAITRSRSIQRLWKSMAGEAAKLSCSVSLVRHADFGGASSGSHMIISWGVAVESAFTPPPSTPRILRHVIDPATRGSFGSVAAPMALAEPPPRSPLVIGGMLSIEGLYDVGQPTLPVCCPSVFSKTGWVQRGLSRKETLRLFDLPTEMDAVLLQRADVMEFVDGITPGVVTSVFRSLWGVVRGGVVRRSRRKYLLPTMMEKSVCQRDVQWSR